MTHTGKVPKHHEPPIIPAEFQTRVQFLLGTLADIDFAHEGELERVTGAEINASFKARMIAKLDEVHQQGRHPYVEELDRLQDWMRSQLLRETV